MHAGAQRGGLADPEAMPGERLVATSAERQVLVGGVQVAEAPLDRVRREHRVGAGQAQHAADGLDAAVHGLVGGQQHARALLQAELAWRSPTSSWTRAT
jgi:hypothetical protein